MTMLFSARFRPVTSRRHGFTLVETVMALGIAGAALAGAMTLNSQQLRLLKSTRSTNAAALCLEERAEALRMATWNQVTSAQYVQGTFFGTAPRSAAPLNNFVEKITVAAYPDPSVCTKLIVQKGRGQPSQLLASGSGLAQQELARIDLEITWTGDNARSRSRSLVAVISNGGIARSNLPAMGSAAGAPPATPGAPPATPVPAATPTSTQTMEMQMVPADGTTVQATPAPSGSGTWWDGASATPVAVRGNTGGQPGKK